MHSSPRMQVRMLLKPPLQAERAARAASAEEIFKNFDPSRSAGLISATGTLTISTANRYVMLEDLNFSGEIFYDGVHYTTVAKADVLRFKGEESLGMNAAVTLSRPAAGFGRPSLCSRRLQAPSGHSESPRCALCTAYTEAGRTTTLEIASTVKADFNARTLDCDSFNTRVTVTGDKTLPSDFEASLSGIVRGEPCATPRQRSGSRAPCGGGRPRSPTTARSRLPICRACAAT